MPDRIDYFSKQSLRSDLKGRSLRGGMVTGAAQVTKVVIGLAVIPLMARLLEKADFGLVAMVSVFTGLATMFVDAGLSMATVQREEINHRQVSNLFWVAAAMGVLLCAVISALAPGISWFYVEPRLTAITLALASAFVFSGLGVQHQALLRRGMEFHWLAVADVSAMIAGQAVAVGWAWTHYRQPNAYWALVFMPITTAVVRTSILWLVCPWRPGLPRRGVGTRELFVFGANLTGFNFLNYFVRNADNLLIGWWWGPAPLGAYERAYKLFLFPIRMTMSPLTGVMVSALSRIVNEPEKYRRFYLNVVGKAALVMTPLSIFLCSTADLAVPAIFGAGWEEAIPVLRALALVGGVQVVGSTFGWLYVTQDRTDDMFRWIQMSGPLLLVAFGVGLPWGPTGVATAYAGSSLLITVPWNVTYACRTGPVSPRDVFGLLGVPVMVGLTAAAGGALSRLLWYDEGAVLPQAIAALGPGAEATLAGYLPVIRFVLATLLAGFAAAAAVVVIPSARSSMMELRQLKRALTPQQPR
ncbi:MAG: lipopolysaccharide biosynthesis protein [Planctomycetota bacterium]